jgi:arylsulfatase A-like enzyme
MIFIKKYSLLLVCLIFIYNNQSSAQEAPNILLIISDDLNTNIGPYINSETHTPNLSKLAAEGVLFNRAYCQYPLCGPSRASLMSGLYPETNGVMGNQHVVGSFRKSNPNLANHPSLAGFFREQGYYTARVSKIFHMGVPGGIERGEAGDDDPDSWDYKYNVLGPETLSKGDLELLSPSNLHYGSNFSRMILKDGTEHTQTDYIATSQAIAILESRAAKVAQNARNKVKQKPKAPFFLAVGLVRPHVPLIAPENCYAPYPDEQMQVPKIPSKKGVPKEAVRQNTSKWGMNETQKKQTIAGYMASIRFMDQQVGRLLNTLEELKLKENTIVIFISDHGYNLGEHDCWSKTSLWEGTVRVPMIISNPTYKQNHGDTCTSITQLIDLYPTLSELAGLSKKQPSILQGKSHAAFIKGNKDLKQKAVAYTISYRGNAATIRTANWRYTRWGADPQNDKEELYSHIEDPEEFNNLATKAKYKDKLLEMRALFDSFREEINK